jgi:hypothetical protein
MFTVLRLREQTPQRYEVMIGIDEKQLEAMRAASRLEPGDIILSGDVYGSVEKHTEARIKLANK